MHFNIWIKRDGKERWTNSSPNGGWQDPKAPEGLTWKQAKKKLPELAYADGRIREVLPDNSPGDFFDQDPGTCPQCGGMH